MKFRLSRPIDLHLLVASYAPLFLAGLIGIYIKSSLMQNYWLGIARLLGQKDVPFLVVFRYFSNDILINLFYIPLLVVLFAQIIFKRRGHVFTTSVSFFMIIIYFVQMRAYEDIGSYISLTMMFEASYFAIKDQDLARNYIPISAFVKLCLALFVTILSSKIILYFTKISCIAPFLKVSMQVFAGLLVLLLICAVGVYPYQYGGLYNSAVQKIFSSLIDQPFSSKESTRSTEENLMVFRQMTNTPKSIINRAPLGKEKESNVLYFIMETGPAEVFPETDASELLPKELRENTLVAYNHQTTYPYTSDAIYSILSGFYPDGRREMIMKGGFKDHKVMFEQLQDNGYQTGAYLPNLYNYELDVEMLKQFGMSTIFVAAQETSVSPEFQRAKSAADELADKLLINSPYFDKERQAWLFDKLTRDLHALQQMKSDILKSLKLDKRFAHVYMPLIGHAPWVRIGGLQNTKAYGRTLMNMQAVWLQEIVTMLKEQNVLENTIIVITADHGIRTEREDADFESGAISRYSFHVPLMIFAPSAFNEPVAVKALTSHIDIEPSVSLLLGLTPDVGVSEGLPLWENAPDRRVYFFAETYGGADGFHQDGWYFMKNIFTEDFFQSSSMNFTSSGQHISDASQRDFVSRALSDFKKNHRNLLSSL